MILLRACAYLAADSVAVYPYHVPADPGEIDGLAPDWGPRNCYLVVVRRGNREQRSLAPVAMMEDEPVLAAFLAHLARIL